MEFAVLFGCYAIAGAIFIGLKRIAAAITSLRPPNPPVNPPVNP